MVHDLNDGRSDPRRSRYATPKVPDANEQARLWLIGFGLMVRAIDGEPGLERYADLLKANDAR